MDNETISIDKLPCCPEVTKEPCCERLRFSYRLTNRLNDVPVEITIVAELERCPGPLSLGDVVYSTTLLPGEKVRLFNSTRNTRFTYDSDSKVSYRHEQSSEETYYMRAMDRYSSDLTATDRGSAASSSSSDFETDVDASYASIGFAGGGSVNVEGNFNSRSASSFMRELSSHVRTSHDRSVQATRAANAVQMGEVQSRTHTQGESEDAYEASTRTFENKNDCHAVTYFAYQLVKQQTLKFRIVSVLRRIVDPAGDSSVEARPVRPGTGVKVLPAGILATQAGRINVQAEGRTSAVAQQANVLGNAGGIGNSGGFAGGFAPVLTPLRFAINAQPVPAETQDAVMKKVDTELVRDGILAQVGSDAVGAKLAAELNFERTFCLPTQGIVVKGCLDRCSTCEESREKSIALDLERKALENKLLAKQIDLLEKSQQYRCCPVGEAEPMEA
ncbi:MAG: hypothetical protein FD150_234 [Rhodobacteraceae bacterium]|nr:MAG: hypothetical protein FD150_234 [Paracoccaceae bacterium]